MSKGQAAKDTESMRFRVLLEKLYLLAIGPQPEEAKSSFFAHLMEAKTFRSRVELVLRDVEKMNVLQKEADKLWRTMGRRRKCLKAWDKTLTASENGNRAFFLFRNHHKALRCFNEALTLLPVNHEDQQRVGNTYCSLFYRRARVLLGLKFHEDCLEDIRRALELEASGEGRHRHRLEALAAECRAEQLKGEQLEDRLWGKSNSSFVCSLIKRANRLLPKASDQIRLSYSSRKGRYIRSIRTIHASDPVVAELPFACYLKESIDAEFCHHCLRQLKGRCVPCNFCVKVRYCSETCSTTSFQSYHKVECDHLDLLHALGLGHLVVRILLVVGVENAIEWAQKDPNSIEPQDQFDTNYVSLLTLVDHVDDYQHKRLTVYTLGACFILLLLEKMGLVSSRDRDSFYSLGGIILKHLLQIACNTIAIYNDGHMIGSGIYPTISLFSHGCDPLLICECRGAALVLKAKKKLAKGAEVTFNYGPRCHVMKRVERQKALKDGYFFDCWCRACIKEAEADLQAFACPQCSGPVFDSNENGKCYACVSKSIDLGTIKRKVNFHVLIYEQGVEEMKKENYSEATKKFLQSHGAFIQLLYEKHSYLTKVKQDLGTCYYKLKRFDLAINYCTQVYKTHKDIFGESHIEVAKALINLSILRNNLAKTGSSFRGAEEYIKAGELFYMGASIVAQINGSHSIDTILRNQVNLGDDFAGSENLFNGLIEKERLRRGA